MERVALRFKAVFGLVEVWNRWFLGPEAFFVTFFKFWNDNWVSLGCGYPLEQVFGAASKSWILLGDYYFGWGLVESWS